MMVSDVWRSKHVLPCALEEMQSLESKYFCIFQMSATVGFSGLTIPK